SLAHRRGKTQIEAQCVERKRIRGGGDHRHGLASFACDGGTAQPRKLTRCRFSEDKGIIDSGRERVSWSEGHSRIGDQEAPGHRRQPCGVPFQSLRRNDRETAGELRSVEGGELREFCWCPPGRQQLILASIVR